MRLLVVSHACVTATNQALFAKLAERTGWEADLIVPRRWKTDFGVVEASRWPAFRGELHMLPVVGSGRIPLHVYARPLRRIVATTRPDAVYVHNEPYAASTRQAGGAARAHGVPWGFYSAQNLDKRYPWPFSAWERRTMADASFGTAVSEEVIGVLREKGYRAGLATVPLGVDTEVYRPAPEADRPPTVGFVGRLTEAKGVDVLLRAVAALPPEVRAIVVGEGPDRAAFTALASSLGLDGRVEWRGYVAHAAMPEAYTELDVLVVPSRTTAAWKEQFGRVVVEALACGVPVVAADSGELPHLMAATGGGVVVPEGNAEALATELRELLAHRSRSRELGHAGRAAVIERFDLGHVADVLASCIRDGLRR